MIQMVTISEADLANMMSTMQAALEAKDKIIYSLLDEIERFKIGVAVEQGPDTTEATVTQDDCSVKQEELLHAQCKELQQTVEDQAAELAGSQVQLSKAKKALSKALQSLKNERETSEQGRVALEEANRKVQLLSGTTQAAKKKARGVSKELGRANSAKEAGGQCSANRQVFGENSQRAAHGSPDTLASLQSEIARLRHSNAQLGRESSDFAAHAQRLAEENSRLTKTLRRRRQGPEELYLEAERLASEAGSTQTAVQEATNHVDKQRLALAEEKGKFLEKKEAIRHAAAAIAFPEGHSQQLTWLLSQIEELLDY